MPTTEYHWEPATGQLLTFDVTYTAEPIRPAVINADPDDCHPAEGGITDIEVELQQAEVVLLDDEAIFMRWFRGLLNIGWLYDFAECAEKAVMEQCKDELEQACMDAEEAEI